MKTDSRDILIIDDEEAVCWALERALSREGHRVAVVASAELGIAKLAQISPEVIFLDIRLPGMDGLTAMPRLRELAPRAAIIVITAFGSLPTAVKVVEGGAFEYLVKPFDLSQALGAVARALQRRPAAEPTSTPQPPPEDMVGVSPAMQQVFKRIALVAPHDACVMISGESGTGKELVARALHRYSTRRDRPFLPVHIAALNENLVESELFGHAKGAFTGATQTRTGLLALADGGTVFFDELAEIPMSIQVKLLRVLEHGEILPVGATQPVPLNLRILTATNQDLNRCVAEGKFRHDLYFRLNVFEVQLPALRERKEDIAPLAEHFLRRFKPQALPLLPITLDYLRQQSWFGNVRELRNALEHAAILARDGALLPEHFPRFTSPNQEPSPSHQLGDAVLRWLHEKIRDNGSEPPRDLHEELLKVVEPALLGELMRRLKGNRWVAGQWLGLNRATVRKKLSLYGLAEVAGDDDSEAP
jgi:two-component system nitrogen regulation response regulator GlnG